MMSILDLYALPIREIQQHLSTIGKEVPQLGSLVHYSIHLGQMITIKTSVYYLGGVFERGSSIDTVYIHTMIY